MSDYSEMSPLLTTEESVQYLKTSRSSLYRLRDAGCITAIYLGGKKPYFRKEDLDHFIERCAGHAS
jgi:excisionase family DNA binding protein